MTMKAHASADHLLRLWAMAEEIYAHPGQTRAELSRRFDISERQIQTDITLLRDAWGLPLLRERHYRFAGPVGSALDLADALTLANLTRTEGADRLAKRLAEHTLPQFPPHVRMVAEGLLTHPRRGRVLRPVVAAAALDGSWLLLHRSHSTDGAYPEPSETVKPLLLVRHAGQWVLICLESQPYGRAARQRALVLDTVVAVSPAVVGRSQKAKAS